MRSARGEWRARPSLSDSRTQSSRLTSAHIARVGDAQRAMLRWPFFSVDKTNSFSLLANFARRPVVVLCANCNRKLHLLIMKLELGMQAHWTAAMTAAIYTGNGKKKCGE